MDLSNLRESLHRLALLEDTAGPIRLSGDESHQHKTFESQEQQQEEGKESANETDMMRVPQRADANPSLIRGGRGGIRVYDNEDDEWDASSSESGKWERAGIRKSMSKRTALMRLRVLMNGVSAILCVSMGSNVNILKPEIAKRARLSVSQLEPPVWVSLDTGKGHGPGKPVQYKACSAAYQIDDFFAQDHFYITPELSTYYVDGIVGIDWLEKYKPTVNYRLNRIELIDLRGRVHVIQSVAGSERGGRGENETQWISARMWDWNIKLLRS